MKKVIKQKKHHPIEVLTDSFTPNSIVLRQKKSGLPDAHVGIDKSKSRKVAMAICPELETEKIQFAVGFAEWISLNGFFLSFEKWVSNDIKHSGCAYDNIEITNLYITSTTNGK